MLCEIHVIVQDCKNGSIEEVLEMSLLDKENLVLHIFSQYSCGISSLLNEYIRQTLFYI